MSHFPLLAYHRIVIKKLLIDPSPKSIGGFLKWGDLQVTMGLWVSILGYPVHPHSKNLPSTVIVLHQLLFVGCRLHYLPILLFIPKNPINLIVGGLYIYIYNQLHPNVSALSSYYDSLIDPHENPLLILPSHPWSPHRSRYAPSPVPGRCKWHPGQQWRWWCWPQPQWPL